MGREGDYFFFLVSFLSTMTRAIRMPTAVMKIRVSGSLFSAAGWSLSNSGSLAPANPV